MNQNKYSGVILQAILRSRFIHAAGIPLQQICVTVPPWPAFESVKNLMESPTSCCRYNVTCFRKMLGCRNISHMCPANSCSKLRFISWL